MAIYRQKSISYDLLLFMLKFETTTRGTNSMSFLVFRRDHLRSTSGIICGSGSFAVQFGDHFQSGDHLRRCTINNNPNFQRMSTMWGKDINLLRKFDLITLNIMLRKIHEITEPGCSKSG